MASMTRRNDHSMQTSISVSKGDSYFQGNSETLVPSAEYLTHSNSLKTGGKYGEFIKPLVWIFWGVFPPPIG